MQVTYPVYNINNDNQIKNVSVPIVGVCPICHQSGRPDLIGGFIFNNPEHEGDQRIFVILQCMSCYQPFVASYISTDYIGSYRLVGAYPKSPTPISFDDTIKKISNSFIEIYSQAHQAEESGLDELAGMGYRKSLEFLVKDYLIYHDASQADEIKQLPLSACIKKIDSPNLQVLARGASWIGNDETHYVRLNPDYNIEHLKLFIQSLIGLITHECAIASAKELVCPHSEK